MLGYLFNVPLGVAYHIVVALSVFLTPLGSGLATAAAIAVFTVGVRLLLWPLSYRAFRGQANLSALQLKISELRKRYSGQPDRLREEVTALYRVERGGMLGGCLPLLLQVPFFSIMYRLFLSATVAGRPNALLTRDLLTTPLGSHWLGGPGPVSAQGLLFIGLFALLAGAAVAAARVSRRAASTAGQVAATDRPAPAAGLLGQILPCTIVVVAAFVPLAAGIYLLTTTACTAAERAVLRWRAHRPVR